MNRPDQLNALSVELRQQLGETFKELKSDTDTKVIILTGNGRAFTAGLDLKELGQTGMGTKDSRSETINVAEAMRDVGKPISPRSMVNPTPHQTKYPWPATF